MKIHQLLESRINLKYWPNDYILDQIRVDSDQAIEIWKQHRSNKWYEFTLSRKTANDREFTDYMLKHFNINSSPDWDHSCYCENLHGDEGNFLLLVYPGDQGVNLIITDGDFRGEREMWLDGPIPLLEKTWEHAILYL